MRRLFIISALAALAAIGATVGVAVAASTLVKTPAAHDSGQALPAASSQSPITSDVAVARLATAKYATNLTRARAEGYGILTRMIPDMGYHFLNPKVSGFSVSKPPILVYEHHGTTWQLGALEWVFTSKPAKPPLPGAQYGTFGAACHYLDGTFVFEDAQSKCPVTSPQTGAKFNFWHPKLITLHFWIWYPNPAGIYSGMNPMVRPFNGG